MNLTSLLIGCLHTVEDVVDDHTWETCKIVLDRKHNDGNLRNLVEGSKSVSPRPPSYVEVGHAE